MSKLAENCLAAEGLNLTLNVHFPFALTAVPHELDAVKVSASAPAIFIANSVRDVDSSLIRVTSLAVRGSPVLCGAKVNAFGLRDTVAEGDLPPEK